MICIVEKTNGVIVSWIIATDTHDARRQAESAGQRDLAAEMYRMEFTPLPGKYPLAHNRWLLVS